MNPPDNLNPPVTLYLQTLCHDLLGEAHYVSISNETAAMILLATQNQHTVFVQLPSDKENVDILGKPLTSPRLWKMDAWRMASERHMRQKILAKQRMDAKNIYDANVRIVARIVQRFTGLDHDPCIVIAHTCLKNNDVARMQAMGVTKLITSVDEL